MLEHFKEHADTQFDDYRVESSSGPNCTRSANFKLKWNAAAYFGQRLLTGDTSWVDLRGRFNGKEWYRIARWEG